MNVPVILGTARDGRESEKVADFVLRQAKVAGYVTELLDARDYRIAATDKTLSSDTAKRLSKKISAADALIIVTPEYNHGYPGELKMMLDLLYREYHGKPLGICGVSSGVLGGARVVEQLRLVSVELHMIPIREAMYFPRVQDFFGDDGEPVDKSCFERLKAFFSELEKYAKRGEKR